MKKALVVSVLPLVLLFGVAFQSSNSVPGQLTTIQSEISALTAKVDSLAANNKGPRQFYLTKTNHNGAQALTACDAGYHMASLWEIFDPTTLRYNTALGFTVDDSGFGPPSGVVGWIRTGAGSSGVSNPGTGNCKAWTEGITPSGDFGTAVVLDRQWDQSQGLRISPWSGVSVTCIGQLQVWCVQN